MQTGETLLVIGAVIIFSLTALSMNQSIFEGNRTLMETQIINSGTAVGLSFIENAKQLSFDEFTVADEDNFDPDSFTAPGNLGAEPGETYPGFDDVDDFHNFSDSVITLLSTFYVTTTVAYVDSGNLNNQVSSRTFFKRFQVVVTSPFIQDSLQLSHIFSHWK